MEPSHFLAHTAPDPAWRPALVALWYAARDDWHRAHDTLQDAVGRDADWVHAHLHRVEGDHPNAAYWYRRAQQPVPPHTLSFRDEVMQIAAVIARAE